jgi:hypothetical protein
MTVGKKPGPFRSSKVKCVGRIWDDMIAGVQCILCTTP